MRRAPLPSATLPYLLRRAGSVAALLSLASSPSCGGPAVAPSGHASSTQAPRPPKEPVVVTLVVDQMAAWIAAERLGELPRDGGFARLGREGTTVTAMRFEHAVTDTAPGHAALYTGAVPARSGIFANEVLGVDHEPLGILRDPDTRLVSAEGPTETVGSSLARLQVDTLADALRTARPDAVIVSLSLKDRGALFGGGRHPTASVWLDVKGNRFVTSTATHRPLPGWAKGPLDAALRGAEASTWSLLDPPWVAAHALTPDAEAGEGEVPGYGTVFPHILSRALLLALAFRTSPQADEVLLEAGLSALDAEDAGAHPTLLAVSLSAPDFIGHTFGPDSWEAWDELARLDRTLARFFRGMDERFGPSGYSVVLAADHGVIPMPETGRHRYCDAPTPDPWRRACGVGHRVLPRELGALLRARSQEALGPGQWVAGVSDPYVILTPEGRALEPARREKLDAVLREVLSSQAGVARLFDLRTLPTACPGFEDESVDALVCRSVPASGRAQIGAFYVVLEPGSFFDPTVVVGKGTSHGSPYFYDRTVPLMARAPGRIAPGAVLPEATFGSFARTAASLLGIAPPADASPGTDLTAAPAKSAGAGRDPS